MQNKLSYKTNEASFSWLYRLFDITMPLITVGGITYAYGVPLLDRYIFLGLFGGLFFITLGQGLGLYENDKNNSLTNSAKSITKAWGLTWTLIIIFIFLLKYSDSFSRVVLSFWAIITFITLIGYRGIINLIARQYQLNSKNKRQVAIVGAAKVGQNLASTLQAGHWQGYEVKGFYDDNLNQLPASINGIDIIGDSNQLCLDAKENIYDEIYICLPLRSEDKIKHLLNALADSAAVIKFIPDLFAFDLIHAKWTDLNGIPVINVFDSPLNNTSSLLIKRTEDIFLSSLILLLILPILAIIAIGIKATSKGPVIFKQTRYGHNGKKIEVYKFRTMACQENGAVLVQAKKNDPRITPIGSILRKTSLDELPQFINVLQGKMSIVGPRPHANAHNEVYRKIVPKYMQRHIVKPGITGWAQINGWRGETDTLEKMEKRVEFDLHYINNWSFWLDIKIITLTIFKGFISKNAY